MICNIISLLTVNDIMQAADKAQEVLERLRNEYPVFDTALRWKEPWQLLAAVLLSAQTTDENINRVTKKLFSVLDTPEKIAKADREQVEQLIYSTGYYKAKASNLQRCMQMLIEKYRGEVPGSMEELVKLPGVGRKTANVVLHILHQRAEGIVMDTHIARVTNRLGFTEKKSPKKGEQVMMELLPKEDWKDWGDYLIQHGRKICHARKPQCNVCPLRDICPSAGSFQQKAK